MKKSRLGFTLGSAFARTSTISIIIDAVMLILGLFAGFMNANWSGFFSALCGWILAIVFSETNAVITVILDALKIKSKQYIIFLIQLWGLKLIAVCALGAIFLSFVSLKTAVFFFLLVFTVFVCTIKNLIITATAQIL
ncbi:hypothetical protein [Alloscardovia omnicolens]|uniref:hypothetical protein n=1 Tax=Alloscardovia omnicolens TaxID=419015 RepID=UPI00243039DD|nr:hypothetical protein [Alloscardovia omnicolens]MBS6346895.1 hypothetical protein [Alloscardovia omnicolens]